MLFKAVGTANLTHRDTVRVWINFNVVSVDGAERPAADNPQRLTDAVRMRWWQ